MPTLRALSCSVLSLVPGPCGFQPEDGMHSEQQGPDVEATTRRGAAACAQPEPLTGPCQLLHESSHHGELQRVQICRRRTCVRGATPIPSQCRHAHLLAYACPPVFLRLLPCRSYRRHAPEAESPRALPGLRSTVCGAASAQAAALPSPPAEMLLLDAHLPAWAHPASCPVRRAALLLLLLLLLLRLSTATCCCYLLLLLQLHLSTASCC